MRKIILPLAALTALVCFADGSETWVMLGDSITHGGSTTGYLQLFWDLRHPGSNVVFENHGHTGGCADAGIRILENDVLKRNPAKVLVMFGMNDVWREQWESAEPGEEEARLRGDALRRYRERMTRIAELVGDRLVFITPTPFDQYGNVKGSRATPLCNEPGLATCAAIVREIAATNRLKVVELHAPLTAAMKRQPEARFAGEDRVHPQEWGHHVMTALIVRQLGESGEVETTRVKADPAKGTGFDYAPKALPFPVSPAYRAAEAFLPITELFNREILAVGGLDAGEWELRMDGRLVGVFSAAEFSKGVNLATLDTPNQRIAQAAKVKADRLNQIYVCQRDCRMGAREKPGATGYGAYLKSVYDRERERLPALAAEAARLRAELRALRPAKCRVSVRRRAQTLPPVNAFVCIGNGDFEDDGAALMRLAKELGDNSPTDFVTLSLRCRPDLNDAKVQDLVRRFIDACHLRGIKVGVDTDPRIARDGFLKLHPGEVTQVVVFNGWKPGFDDHMTGGTRGYEVLKEGLFDQRVHAKVYDLYNCDIFSPHHDAYVEGLMATYKALGADTAMRDEWGLPPTIDRTFADHKAFWYSKDMAKSYHDFCGRSLRDDIVLMGTAPAGKEAERLQAVYKYEELIFRRNAEIERHHYAMTKRLFGPDAYVSKHPTWFPAIDRFDFQKNGLDWWAADRDFAQTDEITPLPARLGLAKKFGGSTWMNEGYQDAPGKYLAEVKRYALSGGRMVFHPVYGGSWGKGLPWAEYRVAGLMSIFGQPGMKETLQKLREIDRATQAQLDSPVALVFGHFEVMNWENAAAYRDWGERTAYGLYAKGWAVDAYPSTELVAGTFRVDADGWLRVGHQRYRALVVKHLSALDLAYVKGLFSAAGVKTRLYVCESDAAAVAAVDADLAAAGAVRQPAAAEELKFMALSKSRVPGASGKATLQDGTTVEF